jgi:transcriptional regulator with XRE-family HTH domain
MSAFGDNLRGALLRVGLTQERAAALCSVTPATMSYYCRLKKPPHRNIVQRISFNLGIRGEELLGHKPPWIAKQGGAEYRAADPRLVWLDTVKLKWKRRSDRDNMALALRIIFESDTDAVLKWLNDP